MSQRPLDSAALLERFAEGARRIFGNYEPRQAQNQMLADCCQAFNLARIALIEAGTGVGKSLAYLVPAAIWSAQTGQKVVIATHTIHLQEQLLEKDIPLAASILDLPISAALAKGMNNYVCQKRVESARENVAEIPKEQFELWSALSEYQRNAQPAARSDIPFAVPKSLWERVRAESDSCLYQACEHFQSCKLMRARSQLAQAQLIIVNHHLLFSDLAQKSKSSSGESSLLPTYSALIVDEAHHAQEIAALHLSATVDYQECLQWLAKLFTGLDPQRPWAVGKLEGLLKLLTPPAGSAREGGDTSGQSRRVQWALLRAQTSEGLKALFCQLGRFAESISSENQRPADRKKCRLATSPEERALWQVSIAPRLRHFEAALRELSLSVKGALEELDAPGEQPSAGGKRWRFFRSEIGALVNRLEQVASALELFENLAGKERVYWLELAQGDVARLGCSELNVGDYLQRALLAQLRCAIFCSGTLTAKNSFAFAREQLGLGRAIHSHQVTEHIYPSPFDYRSQVLFGAPSDLPPPSHVDFLAASCQAITAILSSVRGNSFVLFTSHEAMQATFSRLRAPLLDMGFALFRQGDTARYRLLREFTSRPKAALFGVSAFWEGVDVDAGTLRCVILTKLPFNVPSEPMHQARAETLKEAGKDPFREDALPRAVIAFKQGFGRLIRRREDFGCIVCLDRRLTKSAYGKAFLQALPPCDHHFGPLAEIPPLIETFLAAHEAQSARKVGEKSTAQSPLSKSAE